jgi:RNA polymerase sigma-70 factor, ECF subfamily
VDAEGPRRVTHFLWVRRGVLSSGVVDPSEEAIARALDSGAYAEAATVALRAYGPQIRGYLSAIIGDEAGAGDAFSQFSEDLWKGIKGFRRECSLKTWAYKLAFNAANMQRRDAFRRRVRPILTGEYSLIAAKLTRSTLVHRDPLAETRLTKLRESLTPADQTLLILRVDKGLSWAEIGLVLAVPDAAALRKRFERLRKKLLEQAKRQGLDRAPSRAAGKP